MGLKEELAKAIEGEVADDEATRAKYAHDASLFEIPPRVVAYPKDAGDVEKAVAFVAAHADEGLAITPRSAGTDMSGGAVGESIVLDFTKHFDRILEVGDGHATVQPGVYYRDFEKATLAKGQLLPPYPASREICTVGGMAANNSGGEKSLRYGKTADFVEGLKVVLSDGKTYEIGPLDLAGLERKMAQQDFEGSVYRGVHALIEKRYDAIQASKPDVTKNSAGYALWDVWDRKTFDLSKLFVGSQGTLGLIVEIRYRLIRPQTHSKLLVTFLRDLDRLPEIINATLRFKPESFESYDDHTLKFAIRYFRDILKQMKGQNLLAFAWQFLPELGMFLTGGFPKQVLLAEFTGDSEDEVDAKIAEAKKALAPLKLNMRATKTEAEARKYWIVRRESFNLLRKHFKKMRTAPFIDDFCVKPEQLPKFLPELYAILDRYDLLLTVVGHMGDANFHVIPIMDLGDPETPKIIRALSKEVYDLVFRYGGSMTGEHNDGLIRGPYLKEMFGEEIDGLFREIKTIFDPHGIFNPHKKTGATIDYAMAHLKTS